MKRYKKYKDSGIPWIGEIPYHWEVLKLKYCDKVIMGQSPNSTDYNNNQSGFPFLQGNAEFGHMYPEPKIWCETSNKIAYKNDILLSVRAPIGAVNIANQRYGIGRGLCSIRSTKSNYKFLYYHFLIRNAELNSIGTGSTYTAISSDEVNNLMVPIPSSNEQTSIASFLDRKTSQIDDLIAKKKRLVELLDEEKTAIINQAVTKGLDPNCPMKDSGIPWIGEIPEHWEVKKLKYVANIKYGLGEPPKQKENGLPLIRATNVERGKIVEKDMIFVDPEDIPYDRDPVLKENDIIVVRSGAYTADSAIIPQKYEGAITGYDMVVRVLSENPLFLSYCLLSKYILQNQLYLLKLRAAQPHLNKEELGETLIITPGKSEQDVIVEYLKNQIDRIENTNSKIKREIELLHEYRTVLISEVVTGKIDVRNGS